MEAPEKVYIDDFGSGFSHGWHTEHSYKKDIEYVRKDAFIEKACEFLNSSSILRNTNIVERFKEYMKGE